MTKNKSPSTSAKAGSALFYAIRKKVEHNLTTGDKNNQKEISQTSGSSEVPERRLEEALKSISFKNVQRFPKLDIDRFHKQVGPLDLLVPISRASRMRPDDSRHHRAVIPQTHQKG